MAFDEIPFTDLLSAIVDNRGRTCPTAETGMPLIATNCVRNDLLYPAFDNVRYVSPETYSTWFRGHPEPGDLIFVCKGSPGRVCLAPDPVSFCIAQDMVAVRADPNRVYPKYLFAALRSPLVQSRIEGMHVGTLIPHFKKGDFSKLSIPVPGDNSQRLIGDTYFAFAAKVDVNRRTSRVLESIAQAVYRAWFVDFEPVRAKAAGAKSFPGMPQRVFDNLADTLVDSEVGKIPEGWQARALGDVFEITMGQSPPSAHYNEKGEGLPFHQGVRDYGYRFPVDRVYCTLEARIADAGDVLLSVRAPVGRINVAARRMVIGRGLAAARHPNGYQSYALYSLKHLFAIEDSVGDGTIYKAVTKKFLLSMPIVCPPSDLVSEAEDLLRPLDALLGRGEIESSVLSHTSESLLPKLISGELPVPQQAGG